MKLFRKRATATVVLIGAGTAAAFGVGQAMAEEPQSGPDQTDSQPPEPLDVAAIAEAADRSPVVEGADEAYEEGMSQLLDQWEGGWNPVTLSPLDMDGIGYAPVESLGRPDREAFPVFAEPSDDAELVAYWVSGGVGLVPLGAVSADGDIDFDQAPALQVITSEPSE